MLTAAQSLRKTGGNAEPLPHVPELKSLYDLGFNPRRGELIMVAGTSGSQKSGFALWWASRMNLRTLYLSADMSATQASTRLASSLTGMSNDDVESVLASRGPEAEQLWSQLRESNLSFSYGSPITWANVEAEVEAWVEVYDEFPEMIVVDNLMDVEDCESDYSAQVATMQSLHDLSRATGSNVLVLHHSSEGAEKARNMPWMPPARADILNKLSQKPEQVLTIAVDPSCDEANVALVKQRMGKCDASGDTFATLELRAESTRFAYKPLSQRQAARLASKERKIQTVTYGRG